MQTVAALFIDPAGPYPQLPSVDCWDEKRDARKYMGPHPVVAHPPCGLWVNMAAANYARATRPCTPGCPTRLGLGPCAFCNSTGRREPNRKIVVPAWYPGGDDGGCFAAALKAVLLYGGVLEHPAESHAWAKHNIAAPEQGWSLFKAFGGWQHWVCEVWQSAYGHGARKRTWLLYCGKSPPPQLNWAREPGEWQIGWFDRKKPTLPKREASLTPPEFAKALVELARRSVES